MIKDFEEEVKKRKAEERKKRQRILFEAIAEIRGGLSFEELFNLFKFFEKEDPTDQDIVNATRIVESCVANHAEYKECMRPLGKLDPDSE